VDKEEWAEINDKQEREELLNEHFESKGHKKSRLRKESYRARHSHPNDPDNVPEDEELEEIIRKEAEKKGGKVE
jgi:hypothetical protein